MTVKRRTGVASKRSKPVTKTIRKMQKKQQIIDNSRNRVRRRMK